MTEFGVQSSELREAIYVGRLNKGKTAFLEKVEATDMVLYAVTEYVRDNYAGGLGMTFPGAGLEVFISVKPMQEVPDGNE